MSEVHVGLHTQQTVLSKFDDLIGSLFRGNEQGILFLEFLLFCETFYLKRFQLYFIGFLLPQMHLFLGCPTQ